MLLVNLDNGVTISENLEVASSWAHRARGLLGRSSYPEGSALLLGDCGSIHMFFMKFAIDVLFVDASMTVIKVVESLRPWSTAGARGASSTVELPVGSVRRLGIQAGHRLAVRQ